MTIADILPVGTLTFDASLDQPWVVTDTTGATLAAFSHLAQVFPKVGYNPLDQYFEHLASSRRATRVDTMWDRPEQALGPNGPVLRYPINLRVFG